MNPNTELEQIIVDLIADLATESIEMHEHEAGYEEVREVFDKYKIRVKTLLETEKKKAVEDFVFYITGNMEVEEGLDKYDVMVAYKMFLSTQKKEELK